MPPSEADRARITLEAVEAHMRSSIGIAGDVWMRPWNDLFQFYSRVLNEPAPPPEQWPARLVALSINAATDSLSFHSAAFRTALTACSKLLTSMTSSELEIDTRSEAAGPSPLKLFTNVAPNTPLVAEKLEMAGSTAQIPAANVEVIWNGDQPQFRLVNLLPLQPLHLGCYAGNVRTQANVLVGSIELRVVASIAG